jgi:hypothetical protein
MKQSWVGPRTEAESSGYERTTASAQVVAFVEACAARSPTIVPLVVGRTTEGRPILLALAADPPVRSLEAAASDPRLKVLVMANIHAGEVEGKEAVLVFLREIAEGAHKDVLGRVVVGFVPNYNADGNDRMDRRNRPDQAGPVQGVGQRANGAGLDLNRDFVKVEAAETEALIRAIRAMDAAVVVDCHATNGSFHGFDLTWAGPLGPATDPGILEFERRHLLPELQRRMAARGFATFDYGNWVDDSRPAAGWATFEAVPRFGNSYFGLRNRLTILSEAYSHDPFEKRIRSTYALVAESLAIAAAEAPRIRDLLAAADGVAAGLAEGGRSLPTAARLMRTHESHPIPVGGVREERDPVTGLVRQWDDDTAAPVAMPVFAWFEGLRDRGVPSGWAVRDPTAALRRLLEIHGLEHTTLVAAREADVEIFRIANTTVASRPFQGHRLRTHEGAFGRARETLPRGSLYVPAAQPLARLAFVLFEAESEDGFGTWGLLDAEPDAAGARFAAVRVLRWRDD